MLIPEQMDEIFSALERHIREEGGSKISLVIIGGTALAVLGRFVRQATKDVDVLGEAVESQGQVEIRKLSRFPPFLEKAIKKVARDFRLPENWMNLGPASQLDLGLPEGFHNRLIRKAYGSHLVLYFASREDLIHLKLFAAVDRDDYHVQDLFALEPTREELLRAARWVLTQDVSPGFRAMLEDFLRGQGYEDIIEQL